MILALGEPRDWSGEDGSRSDLGLPGRQQELFDAVAATGKPVIVVLFNGRPLAIPRNPEKGRGDFGGVVSRRAGRQRRGGRACSATLTRPAGLTTTFPYNVGQVPIYYNHFNTGRPGFGEYKGNYVDGPTTPLLSVRLRAGLHDV